MSEMNSGVSSIQSLQAEASAQALQKSMTSVGVAPDVAGNVAASTTVTKFDGTIGDLKKKYPEVYDKLIVQSIGYQIVHQCQRDNDHYMRVIKENRRS